MKIKKSAIGLIVLALMSIILITGSPFRTAIGITPDESINNF